MVNELLESSSERPDVTTVCISLTVSSSDRATIFFCNLALPVMHDYHVSFLGYRSSFSLGVSTWAGAEPDGPKGHFQHQPFCDSSTCSVILYYYIVSIINLIQILKRLTLFTLYLSHGTTYFQEKRVTEICWNKLLLYVFLLRKYFGNNLSQHSMCMYSNIYKLHSKDIHM